MEIVEAYMEGKVDAEHCEDSYFISDDFVVVVDGVTSKSDFLHHDQTTGRLAAQMVRRVFETMPRQASVHQIIREINHQINDFYETVPFPYSRKEKGLQAVCAIYSNYFRTVWLIGDCQVLVDGKLYTNSKKSDDILSQMRSLILNILKEDPQKDWNHAQQEARSVIEPWILKSNQFANAQLGEFDYAVLNGEEIPDRLIQTIALDENAHEIVLASDGYPKAHTTLEQSEYYLNRILQQDPACYRIYPSTKGIANSQTSFDDRTYIRFRVEQKQQQ